MYFIWGYFKNLHLYAGKKVILKTIGYTLTTGKKGPRKNLWRTAQDSDGRTWVPACSPRTFTCLFCCLSLRSCLRYQSPFCGCSPRRPRAGACRALNKAGATPCSKAKSTFANAEDAEEGKGHSLWKHLVSTTDQNPFPSPKPTSISDEGNTVQMASVLEHHRSTRSWDWKRTLKSSSPGVPSRAVRQLTESWTTPQSY